MTQPATDPLTSKDLLAAVIKTYCDRMSCANLTEFKFASDEQGSWERRIDLLTIYTGGSPSDWCAAAMATRNHIPCGYRIAFELKVSKGDLARDLAARFKHQPVARCVNEFYFVLAAGLMDEGNYYKLPWGSGVIVVERDARRRWLGTPRARVAKVASLSFQPETPPSFFNQLAARTLYGQESSGRRALTKTGNFLI